MKHTTAPHRSTPHAHAASRCLQMLFPVRFACLTCRQRDSQSDGSVPQTAADRADGDAAASGGTADGARQHSGNSTALTWDALQPLGHGRRAYSGEHSDTPDDDQHRTASDNAAAGTKLGSSAAVTNSGSIVGNHKVADCMLLTCSKLEG